MNFMCMNLFVPFEAGTIDPVIPEGPSNLG